MQALVGVQFGNGELLELLHRLPYACPDRLLQLLVLVPEGVGESQLRQRTVTPTRCDAHTLLRGLSASRPLTGTNEVSYQYSMRILRSRVDAAEPGSPLSAIARMMCAP